MQKHSKTNLQSHSLHYTDVEGRNASRLLLAPEGDIYFRDFDENQPSFAMGLFPPVFPCSVVGGGQWLSQRAGHGGLQCALAPQHSHHLLFSPKQLGNLIQEHQPHTGRRDRNKAPLGCPAPGTERVGEVLHSRFCISEFLPKAWQWTDTAAQSWRS